MSIVIAAGAAVGVFMTVMWTRPERLSDRVEQFLHPRPKTIESSVTGPGRAAKAGLDWSENQLRIRRMLAACAGGLAGLFAAQGNLFLAGPGRSAPALIAAGTAAGWLAFGMHLSTRAERRATRLRSELPVIAEAIALHIVAGESVSSAIARFVESAGGVASEEFSSALSDAASGVGLAEALHRASKVTADPEAGRLYSLLGHAHVSGGRLVGSLTELARDYRAALARELTQEGGRRAIATYGPVLGLMVPVTLLFLLYPTITGLRSLAP